MEKSSDTKTVYRASPRRWIIGLIMPFPFPFMLISGWRTVITSSHDVFIQQLFVAALATIYLVFLSTLQWLQFRKPIKERRMNFTIFVLPLTSLISGPSGGIFVLALGALGTFLLFYVSVHMLLQFIFGTPCVVPAFADSQLLAVELNQRRKSAIEGTEWVVDPAYAKEIWVLDHPRFNFSPEPSPAWFRLFLFFMLGAIILAIVFSFYYFLAIR